MKSTWIVLANSGRARIFERSSDNGQLVEMLDLVHPRSRATAAALTTDREGYAQKAHGDAGHAGTAFEPHTTPHQKEQASFAAEVARHLEVAATQGRCVDLALFASDPFLGALKVHLGSAGKRVLSATIPRDFTTFSGPELAHRVTEALVHLRYH